MNKSAEIWKQIEENNRQRLALLQRIQSNARELQALARQGHVKVNIASLRMSESRQS